MMTKLEQWRRDRGLSYRAFGSAIGTTGQYAENICKNGIPGMTRVAMIMLVTNGEIAWREMLTDKGKDIIDSYGLTEARHTGDGEEDLVI